MWSIERTSVQPFKKENGLARLATWKVNGKTLETPCLFVSHSLGGGPVPWQIPNLTTILVSAYDIYNRKLIYRKILEHGIHARLREKSEEKGVSFPQETIILLDSGGFSYLHRIEELERKAGESGKQEERKKLRSQLEKIHSEFETFSNSLHELFEKGRPDIAVTLDFPIDPRKKGEEIERRIAFSRKKISEMCSWHIPSGEGTLAIMPVIHPIPGVSSTQPVPLELFGVFDEARSSVLNRAFAFVDKDVEQHIRTLPAIGIGSLIPLLMARVKQGKKEVVEILSALRNSYDLQEKFIHAFGVGGTTSMHLAYYLGMDSVDCAGWRRRAIYGIIQLPGIGDRYVSENARSRMKWKGIAILNEEEKRFLLEECGCPVCSRDDLDLERDFGQLGKGSSKSFSYRAIHNLYTYVKEAEKARQVLRGEDPEFENFEDFVEKRLERSPIHSRFFQFVKNRVRSVWSEMEFQKR